MPRIGKAKSENHHWWPVCVSKHWKNAEAKVHWLKPNGEIVAAPPKNFGVIGNGHYIKLGRDPDKTTLWDQNFEPIFANADRVFPSVISWLQSLVRKNVPEAKTLTDRFLPQDADDEQIAQLVESLVSLAVRSPMQRESAVGVAETIRGVGRLPERERNALITMNMRHSHQQAVSQIGTRGKFVVLYSPTREFIFGDGFFHNIRSPVQPQINSYKLLVPITPEISVLYASPQQYMTEPRLCTFVVSTEEADILNDAIQIYARNFIFFRSKMPAIISEYKEGTHLRYSDSNNPIDRMIHAIPGIRRTQFYLS